jgi:hypothetical protein
VSPPRVAAINSPDLGSPRNDDFLSQPLISSTFGSRYLIRTYRTGEVRVHGCPVRYWGSRYRTDGLLTWLTGHRMCIGKKLGDNQYHQDNDDTAEDVWVGSRRKRDTSSTFKLRRRRKGRSATLRGQAERCQCGSIELRRNRTRAFHEVDVMLSAEWRMIKQRQKRE